MAGIGIVSNPRSRRNLVRPRTAEALRRLLGDAGALHEAATPEELERALAALRRAGIDTLAVNGGDGTLHVVVTALARTWEGPWPRLLPLRGGSMNTVASAHGLRGSPEVALQRLLELRRAGGDAVTVERDLLQVEAPGQPARIGFLFGTGLAVAFLEEWHQRGPATRRSALRLLLRAALSAGVDGPLSARLSRFEPMRVSADGEEWPADAFLSVVAGAIPDIGFGFLPLARCAEQPGSFHAVGVTGSLARLALRLPAVWLARPWHRPLALDAVVRDLLLEAPRLRITVDGDLFSADGPVRVRTGPLAHVLLGRPGRRRQPEPPR
jgi:diacylglycerol kinase family enzyme